MKLLLHTCCAPCSVYCVKTLKEEKTVDNILDLNFEDDAPVLPQQEEEDSYEIITSPDDFSAVREALEKEKLPMASAEVTMIPQNYVTLTDENDIRQLQRTLDLLDEDDDVQDVYHNWDE